MSISHIITGISVLLTGLLPVSCHKSATTAKTPAASPATIIVSPTSAPQHELGQVSLTNHLDTCLQLGGGKDCTLTPHILDGRNLSLTLELESKTANGLVHDVSVTQVSAKSGQSVDVAVGNYQLSFTPNIISAE